MLDSFNNLSGVDIGVIVFSIVFLPIICIGTFLLFKWALETPDTKSNTEYQFRYFFKGDSYDDHLPRAIIYNMAWIVLLVSTFIVLSFINLIKDHIISLSIVLTIFGIGLVGIILRFIRISLRKEITMFRTLSKK